MTRILLGAIAVLAVLLALTGFYAWWQTKASASARSAVNEAVAANEALLEATQAWQKVYARNDALLADNRRDHHDISSENARLRAELATAEGECLPRRPPDVVLAPWVRAEGGNEGRAGGGLPAREPH